MDNSTTISFQEWLKDHNGDVTQWTYHSATGLELSKIYADGSSEVRTYDAFNRLATITDARGVMKTHTYDVARGLLLSESYSDGSTGRSYATTMGVLWAIRMLRMVLCSRLLAQGMALMVV